MKEQRRTEEAARRQKLRAADEQKVKEQRRNEEAGRRQKLRSVDEEKVKNKEGMKKQQEYRN